MHKAHARPSLAYLTIGVVLAALACGDDGEAKGGDDAGTAGDSNGGAAAGGSSPAEGSSPLQEPCNYFTDEIAELLVDGPFEPAEVFLESSASSCQRSQSQGFGTAFARFESGYSLETVRDRMCKGLTEIPDLGLYACEIAIESIVMLSSDGKWLLQVGNAPIDKCKAALVALEAKLR